MGRSNPNTTVGRVGVRITGVGVCIGVGGGGDEGTISEGGSGVSVGSGVVTRRRFAGVGDWGSSGSVSTIKVTRRFHGLPGDGWLGSGCLPWRGSRCSAQICKLRNVIVDNTCVNESENGSHAGRGA